MGLRPSLNLKWLGDEHEDKSPVIDALVSGKIMGMGNQVTQATVIAMNCHGNLTWHGRHVVGL